MIFQLLYWLVGMVFDWFLQFEPPVPVWSALNRGQAGIVTLGHWMPEVPYIPYAALALGVTVLLGAWSVLLFGNVALRLATSLKFLGAGPR